ncbi:MAG: hypothetical protein K5872_22855 [Rhizobiaceae bacterium]|nr:hypothetical protein [Rhizobiaceae bacterium]MCV0409063.1 hypothetical protein [Rhizobiaceae bacterium]
MNCRKRRLARRSKGAIRLVPDFSRKPVPRIVAQVHNRMRIIECRDGIQWIVQRRGGWRHGRERWDDIKYFRSRAGLLGFLRALQEDVEPSALETVENLPAWAGEDK